MGQLPPPKLLHAKSSTVRTCDTFLLNAKPPTLWTQVTFFETHISTSLRFPACKVKHFGHKDKQCSIATGHQNIGWLVYGATHPQTNQTMEDSTVEQIRIISNTWCSLTCTGTTQVSNMVPPLNRDCQNSNQSDTITAGRQNTPFKFFLVTNVDLELFVGTQ